ncbi:uncharacterized protein M6B38_183745 [Iris pallida]|uniref:FLZ-type domain-containing protein n=1 Tax=Iris pallida TaxID=29817 RepID=A0AAX6EKR3_IRIPA|nr:uncharacterized protein M6B38_183745 [Iris pallida]
MEKPYPSSFESLYSDVDSPSFPIYPSRPKPAPAGATRFSYDHLFSDDDGDRHFLDSCFLCRKPLGVSYGRDIFMYRGNTPFCSEECRQEQIEIDEANEKKQSKMNKKRNSSRSSDSGSSRWEKIDVRAAAGAVVAG